MSRAAIDASLKTLASGKQLFQVFANQGFVALGQRNQGMELMGILFVDFKVLKSGPINGDVPEVRIQPDNQRRSGKLMAIRARPWSVSPIAWPPVTIV